MTYYPLDIIMMVFMAAILYWCVGLVIADECDARHNWNNWLALAFSFVWLPAFFFIMPYMVTKAFINMRIWDQHNLKTRS